MVTSTTNVMLFTGLYTVTVLHIKWLKTSPCFSLSITLSLSLHKTTTEKPRGRNGDLEGARLYNCDDSALYLYNCDKIHFRTSILIILMFMMMIMMVMMFSCFWLDTNVMNK